MNKSGIQLIEEELAHVGESSPVSPLLLELDKYRIMSDTPVPSEQFLLEMFGKPCFPRRDLTAITGMEKCGKTFFTSMLMACCLTQKCLALERHTDIKPHTEITDSTDILYGRYAQNLSKNDIKNTIGSKASTERLRTDKGHTDGTDDTDLSMGRYAQNYNKNDMKNHIGSNETEIKPLRVLWYDTEQSRQCTHDIMVERIIPLAQANGQLRIPGSPFEESFFVFNVRACTYEQRVEYLITAIETYRPDMVIIDNVSDLLSSINDSEQSIKLIDQLMQLSTTYDCNITVVIHLNRSGEKRNLRGWLGTEILHKAFDVYYCEQLPKSQVFAVEQLLSRKYRINETLYYGISDEGLPVMTGKPDIQPRDSDGKYMSNKPEAYQIREEKANSFNQDYIIRHEGDSRMPWEWDLRRLFDNAMEGRAQMTQEDLQEAVMRISGIQQPKYYDKVFRLACDKRIIQTTMNRNGRVVVISIPS